MNNYNFYQEARNASWRFLLENGINCLPLPLNKICQKNGFKLMVDVNGCYLGENDKGVTFQNQKKEWCILLNPNYDMPVRRFTASHEMGHIYMEHPMQNSKYGLTFGIQSIPYTSIEYQAERFAINILAPACVLYGLNLHTPEDIAEVCNISMQAAEIRAERMEILYKRNKFLTSPLEKKVFEQFEDYIKANR